MAEEKTLIPVDKPKPVDLYYPDSYHRVKRAALAFGAALILLPFAVKTNAPGIPIGGSVSNLLLPIVLTQIALAVALLWNAAHFFAEFQSAQVLNAPIVRSEGFRNLDAALDNVRDQIDQMLPKIMNAVKQFEAVFTDFARRLSSYKNIDAVAFQEEMHRRFLNTIKTYMLNDVGPEEFIQATNRLAEHIGDDVFAYLERLDITGIEKHCVDAAKHAVQKISEAQEQIHILRNRFDRLDSNITRGRQASYWLDALGVGVTAAGAIAITLLSFTHNLPSMPVAAH